MSYRNFRYAFDISHRNFRYTSYHNELSIYPIENIDIYRIMSNSRYIVSFCPVLLFLVTPKGKVSRCTDIKYRNRNASIMSFLVCRYRFERFFFRFIGIISIRCLVIRLRPCILMSTPGPRQMRSTIEVAQSR